jgi:hypothetical protein
MLHLRTKGVNHTAVSRRGPRARFPVRCSSARNVSTLVAQGVNFSYVSYKLQIVVVQFRHHIEWRQVFGIVVQHALQTADLTNPAQRRATELSYPLHNTVGAANICSPCSSSSRWQSRECGPDMCQ